MINQIRIDASRLLRRLGALGKIGVTGTGGVARIALTDFDRQGRDQVVSWMRQASLDVQVDTVGNVFGTRRGKTALEPVMSGSHLDSVHDGGRLDGSYGVLAALEVIDTLNDAGVVTRRPLVVSIFTNEEGVRFQPDMMGSLAHAGGITVEEVLGKLDRDGVSIGSELNRIGYAGGLPCGAIRPRSFIELHIEQGPVLERTGKAIGAVEDLQGISWTEIILRGQSNHAGTTPMSMRSDAGYCVAAVSTFVRELAEQMGPSQVATVGSVEFGPNLINVVPGYARMTVDLRNSDNNLLTEAEFRLRDYVEALANREGVSANVDSLARFDPVRFHDGVVGVIENKAMELGLSCQRMTSGAGHDAQMMSRIADTAMIFVPSRGGVSHAPDEHTDDHDLIAGANVLLQSVLDLANQ